MTIERILITGGAGFIGSHTAEHLLQQGYQVVVLDNLSSGKLTNLPMRHPDLDFIEGDILDFYLLEELVGTVDAVLHLAAIASVPFSFENPIYSFQVNTQGSLHVFEAVRKTGRPIRVVYASSAAVYGQTTALPCRDDQSVSEHFLSPYALHKWQSEQYADLYARLHGVKSLGLRYFNVYGLRQDPASPYSGVISRYLAACEQGAPLMVFGDGEQSRDFIHIDDIVKANLLALTHPYAGVLNIATGQPQTLLQLIDYIKKARGSLPDVRMEPARPGDIRASWAATAQAEEQLKFKATISLEDGIARIIPG